MSKETLGESLMELEGLATSLGAEHAWAGLVGDRMVVSVRHGGKAFAMAVEMGDRSPYAVLDCVTRAVRVHFLEHP